MTKLRRPQTLKLTRSRVATAISLAAVTLSAHAQGANASLTGIISDSTGAQVAHAHVIVTEQSRMTRRVVDTNAVGLYNVPQLLPGTYTVTVEAPGFARTENTLVLTVGQRGSLDVHLNVQAASTNVNVSASQVAIEQEDPALSTVTNEYQIQQLPLNGRDVTQLAILSTGVVPSRRVNPDSQGLGRQISVSGRRTNQVDYLLDGSDVNDAYNNTPGGAGGDILGVDSIGQFRVLANGYGAEFGRTGGGIIDVVTHGGGNALHGSAFEFARNSALDAKNYFDVASLPIPSFHRNQFGGALGGPIRKDKLFFFGNYEGLRASTGITTSALVPNNTARASAVAAVRPFLAILPQVNSTVFTDGTGYYKSTVTATAQEDFAIGRIDWTVSDKTSFFGRFQFDNANVYTPDSLQISSAHNRSRAQYLTFQSTHTFNDHLVNNARVSYNRSYFTLQYDIIKSIDPSLSFVPGNPFGSISVTGLAMIGPMRFGPNVNQLNLVQGSDDLTYTRGRHTIAFGVDEKQIIFPQESAQSQNGFYQFTSVANFMAGTASSVEIALPGSNPQREWRQHMDAAYITDTWRASDALTLTGGLRYERTSAPSEVNGLQATVRNPLTDTADTIGPLYTNPSNLNFAPRVGFALTPGSKQTTSIRGAFGIYFDPLWTDFYLNAGSRQPPFFTVGTSKGAPTFPNTVITPANFVLGRIDVTQYHPASPYVMQWNLSMQQQLARGAVLTVAYNANKGVHDQRIVDENQALPSQIINGRKFFASNSTVRNPNFTSIRLKETNGLSNFNSVQVAFNWQRSQLLQLRTSYVYGKSLDTSSLVSAQGTENDLPQDPDSLAAEYGPSNYDLRNFFSAAIVSNLPRFKGPEALTGGWQLNLITLLSSGAPFSALISYDYAHARFGTGPSQQRPDLAPGRSGNPVKGGPVQYFDPTAFALPPTFNAGGLNYSTYGNLGRNTLVGPGLISVDGAVAKNFHFGERAKLQLRAEIFNLPNRPNFAIPSQRNVFTTGGVRMQSAGTITSTLTSSRQIQFGARFDF